MARPQPLQPLSLARPCHEIHVSLAQIFFSGKQDFFQRVAVSAQIMRPMWDVACGRRDTRDVPQKHTSSKETLRKLERHNLSCQMVVRLFACTTLKSAQTLLATHPLQCIGIFLGCQLSKKHVLRGGISQCWTQLSFGRKDAT